MSLGAQMRISGRGMVLFAGMVGIIVGCSWRFGSLHLEIARLRSAVPARVAWAASLDDAAISANETSNLPELIGMRTPRDPMTDAGDQEALNILTESPGPADLHRAAGLVRRGTGAVSLRLGELIDETRTASLVGVLLGVCSLVAMALWLRSVTTLDGWRARWMRLSRAAADGTFDWDLATGKVEFAETDRVGAHTERTGTIHDWYGTVHPEDLPTVRAALELHLSGESPMFEAEFRQQKGQDGWRYVLARGIADRPAGIRASHLACWQTDITDRRQAVAALASLRASEAEFRRALDAVPDALFILRGERVLFANAVARDAFSGDSVPDDVVAALRQGSSEPGPTRIPLPGERPGSWEVSAPTGIIFGDESADLLVARDVGPRIRMEGQLRAAERMVALGGLAAGLAHEINNPLTYVIGNLELAQEGVGDVRARLARALGGAVRVRQVVSQLRALANPNDGDLVAVNVGPAVESAITLALGVGHPPASLHRDFAQSRPVRGNPIWLGQIALNVVTNALQAMAPQPRASRHLHIRALPLPDGGTVVEFVDSGPGIPADVAERLFEPFTTSRLQSGGSGLGLYICRELATRMGGALELAASDSSGTTFRLTLPSADALPASGEAGVLPAARRRGRVLVVDDERVIVELLQNYLGHHHVEACYNAEDAAAMVATGHWDAVVLDIILPDRSGIELFDEITANAPELAARVLFVTGGSLAPDVARFLMRAPNPALLKPFDFRELVAQVDALVLTSPEGPPVVPPPALAAPAGQTG